MHIYTQLFIKCDLIFKTFSELYCIFVLYMKCALFHMFAISEENIAKPF